MPRSITVSQPVMYPACCISCGAAQISGRWFIDLGFDIDERFDAMPDGVVYLCSICTKNMIFQLMEIVERQEMGLSRVRFDGNRTDPVFDEYREVLNRGEPTVDEHHSNSSETEKRTTGFSATFGG